MENENLLWFILDLTTTNAVSRPLSAPVVSSSAIVDNSSDRSKDTSIINTDVTVSLKKNRSGEDKGKFYCNVIQQMLPRWKCDVEN